MKRHINSQDPLVVTHVRPHIIVTSTECYLVKDETKCSKSWMFRFKCIHANKRRLYTIIAKTYVVEAKDKKGEVAPHHKLLI